MRVFLFAASCAVLVVLAAASETEKVKRQVTLVEEPTYDTVSRERLVGTGVDDLEFEARRAPFYDSLTDSGTKVAASVPVKVNGLKGKLQVTAKSNGNSDYSNGETGITTNVKLVDDFSSNNYYNKLGLNQQITEDIYEPIFDEYKSYGPLTYSTEYDLDQFGPALEPLDVLETSTYEPVSEVFAPFKSYLPRQSVFSSSVFGRSYPSYRQTCVVRKAKHDQVARSIIVTLEKIVRLVKQNNVSYKTRDVILRRAYRTKSLLHRARSLLNSGKMAFELGPLMRVELTRLIQHPVVASFDLSQKLSYQVRDMYRVFESVVKSCATPEQSAYFFARPERLTYL